MNPTKKNHEFSITIEPRTGIPLSIKAQLQVNIFMESYPWTPIQNLPELMMPIFWFRQVTKFSPKLITKAKITIRLIDYSLWFAFLLASTGGLLIILTIYCFTFQWRRDAKDESIL